MGCATSALYYFWTHRVNDYAPPPPQVSSAFGGGGGSEVIGEDVRLEHRLLDLRRAVMQRNIRLRSAVTHAMRNFLHGACEPPFTEVRAVDACATRQWRRGRHTFDWVGSLTGECSCPRYPTSDTPLCHLLFYFEFFSLRRPLFALPVTRMRTDRDPDALPLHSRGRARVPRPHEAARARIRAHPVPAAA